MRHNSGRSICFQNACKESFWDLGLGASREGQVQRPRRDTTKQYVHDLMARESCIGGKIGGSAGNESNAGTKDPRLAPPTTDAVPNPCDIVTIGTLGP